MLRRTLEVFCTRRYQPVYAGSGGWLRGHSSSKDKQRIMWSILIYLIGWPVTELPMRKAFSLYGDNGAIWLASFKKWTLVVFYLVVPTKLSTTPIHSSVCSIQSHFTIVQSLRCILSIIWWLYQCDEAAGLYTQTHGFTYLHNLAGIHQYVNTLYART